MFSRREKNRKARIGLSVQSKEEFFESSIHNKLKSLFPDVQPSVQSIEVMSRFAQYLVNQLVETGENISQFRQEQNGFSKNYITVDDIKFAIQSKIPKVFQARIFQKCDQIKYQSDEESSDDSSNEGETSQE